MATLAEAEAHRAAIADVETLAIAALVDGWAAVPLEADAGAPVVRDLLGDLTATYQPIGASLGADWYEDLRDQAGVPGTYTATLPPAVPTEAVSATASWAAAGLKADSAKALADASAALQRWVAIGDREAISLNAERDPQTARWARYASSNACAFCALMATRGPVYRSQATAEDRYHSHCRCIAVPVWNRDDYEEAPYVGQWRDAYYDATDRLDSASDTKAILADMRRNAGLR